MFEIIQPSVREDKQMTRPVFSTPEKSNSTSPVHEKRFLVGRARSERYAVKQAVEDTIRIARELLPGYPYGLCRTVFLPCA